MHLGKKVDFTYRLFGQEIEKVSEEKDLGIYIDSQLNFKLHIDFKIKKANQMLGLLKRSFNYMDKEMFLILYKSLIRPHLEYGSAIWSIPYKKESTKLENIQRRATKILPEMKNKSYTERLRSLGLPSLEYRRLRSDLIQAFKIHKNIDRLDVIKLFPKSSNPARLTTRGHSFKLYKPQCRTNIRKFCFALQ